MLFVVNTHERSKHETPGFKLRQKLVAPVIERACWGTRTRTAGGPRWQNSGRMQEGFLSSKQRGNGGHVPLTSQRGGMV